MRKLRHQWAMFSREKDLAMFLPALHRIAEQHPDKIDKFSQPGALGKIFSEALNGVVPWAAATILKHLKADAPAMRRGRRALFTDFERRLYRSWRKPLDLLEMLIVIATESGEAYNEQWAWSDSTDKDIVFDVIRRLHARGCQVAQEVLTLLRAGYASGAHARWRALHETNVTAMFVAKHGKETAESYLLHEHIESYRAGLGYQQHCKRLGYRPFTAKEMAEMKSIRDQLIAQYGKPFGGLYGWAAAALKRTDQRVKFSDLEDDLQLAHWRPHYKMASHPVHANPKAITFNLGLRPRQKLLLTGPSNFGLVDPGHGTALSLMQLTITMICMDPTVDSVLTSHVMMPLVDEIGEEFIKSQKALMARAKRVRARPARMNGKDPTPSKAS